MAPRRSIARLACACAMTLLAFFVRAAAATPDPLADWPESAAPRTVGARVTSRFLATPHMFLPSSGTIHYAEICTWYGALTYAQLADERDLSRRLAARFEPLLGPETVFVPPVDHVDHAVFGVVPLELYRQFGHARHRTLGLAFADGQWDRPRPDGLTWHARFWIDDMYMITALQTQAFRVTAGSHYLDRTATAMVAYLDRLQRPNGLFYHAPDTPFHWGRGNGWMAAGMTELLRELPEGQRDHARILAGYRAMMAALLQHQAPDGMWRQLVDQPDSWPETSCTAMFSFAYITGVKRGWLDRDAYGPAARRAWLTLTTYLDEHADVREVCVGTGTKNDRQYYLDRPRSTGDFHGQAPLLWCASALLRN